MLVGGQVGETSWVISLVDLFGFYSVGKNLSAHDDRLFGYGTYGGMIDGTVFMYGASNSWRDGAIVNAGPSILIDTFENAAGMLPNLDQNLSIVVEDESCIYALNVLSTHMTKHFLGPNYNVKSVGPLKEFDWRCCSLVSYSNFIYIIGGYFGHDLTNQTWLVNVLDCTVIEGPRMRHNRGHCSSCVFIYNGKPHLVVTGGYGEGDDGQMLVLDSVEMLDLEPVGDEPAHWFSGISLLFC